MNTDTTRAQLNTLRKSVRLAAEKAKLNDSVSTPDHCLLSTQERQSVLAILLVTAIQVLHQRNRLRLLSAKVTPSENSVQALLNLLHKAAPVGLMPMLGVEEETQFDSDLIDRTNRVMSQNLDLKHLENECIVGYVYQFLCEPARKQSVKRVQSANKSSSAADIVGFTQLYTPGWVADYLIDRALEHRGSADLKILDPSCGAGHFLSRAYKYLLDRPEPSTRDWPRHILQNCLYGCDLDAMGVLVTTLALLTEYLSYGGDELPERVPRFNLSVLPVNPEPEPILGSLARNWPADHPLAGKYDAVIGNPPYLGRKLVDRNLKKALKELYPDSHQDLCTAFIARGIELLKPNGRLAYITQTSLLYLPTYARFRASLLDKQSIIEVVEAGTQVFPLQSGEKINSILLVLQNGRAQSEHAITYRDLRQANDKAAGLVTSDDSKTTKVRLQKEFILQTRNALNFNCPEAFFEICRRAASLQDVAEIKQGLATTDNERFLRRWWQVPAEEIGKRWFPYVKGNGCERWYGPIDTVVDWEDDGLSIKKAVAEAYPYLNGKTAWVVKNEQYYRKEGLTFSFVNSREFAVRHLPPGCIFDVAGSAVFPNADIDKFFLLAYLNSSFINAAASWINPTINFQVGDLKQLPMLEFTNQEKQQLRLLAESCLENKRFVCAYTTNGWQLANSDDERTALSAAQWDKIIEELKTAVETVVRDENLIDDMVNRKITEVLAGKEKSLQITEHCSIQLKNRKKIALPFCTAEEAQRWWASNLGRTTTTLERARNRS